MNIKYKNNMQKKLIDKYMSLPSVNLARPPVGWHKIVEHPVHITTL